MPAIVFPSNPLNGDEAVLNGRTWYYDSSVPAWRPKADMVVPPEMGGTYVAHSTVQSLSDVAKRRAQSNIGLPKFNLTATVAPAVTDDATAGYSVLSLWADVAHDLAYICLDSTASAAVWLPISITAELITSLVSFTGAFADITTVGETVGEIVRIKDPGGLETIPLADLRDLIMPFKTRTAVQGSPSGTTATLNGVLAESAYLVTGATNPLVNGVWIEVGTLNGKPDYRVDAAIAGTAYGAALPLPVSPWPRLSWSGGKWQFYGPDFQPIYSVVSTSGNPGGLAFEVDVAGSGTPPIVGSFNETFPFFVDFPTVAAFEGQLCRVGDTPNGPFVWWRWDGAVWRPETADLSALSTSGFAAGNYARVKASGGLEPLTPAQVRDDVVPVRLNRGRILIDSSGMTTDGLSAPAFYGELLYAGDFDSHMSFTGDGTPQPSITSSVGLYWSGSHWTLFDGPYEWWSDSDVYDPVDATGWYPAASETGSPILTSDYEGDFIGQVARTGIIAPYDWYRWDGFSWEQLGGTASAVAWEDITGRPATFDPTPTGVAAIAVRYDAAQTPLNATQLAQFLDNLGRSAGVLDLGSTVLQADGFKSNNYYSADDDFLGFYDSGFWTLFADIITDNSLSNTNVISLADASLKVDLGSLAGPDTVATWGADNTNLPYFDAAGYFSCQGSPGFTGEIATAGGNIVVTGGIITDYNPL